VPRAYMPLKSVAHPPLVAFANGVRVVLRDSFNPPGLEGWEQVFRPDDLKEMRDWYLAIACDWSVPITAGAEISPEVRLADTRLALQVAAPTGTFLSVCIKEQDDNTNPRLMVRELEKLHGTTWSRMKGFNGITANQVQSIVNGILLLLETKDARTTNPLRIFEQGLVAANPYVRFLLWVTAIDGILMAVKEQIFISRLASLLGAESLVFPPDDGVYINRPTLVKDVAKDLFVLRSEIAHGRAISKKFWEVRDDLVELLPRNAYGEHPRYFFLLEEVALALLTRILGKIVTSNLLSLYAESKKWKAYLENPINGPEVANDSLG
jgi:hypothetical protein